MNNEVYFIRHGESQSNAGARTRDHFSVGLSENGVSQADKVANYIKNCPDLIVTSSFVRTKMTAEPLIKQFPDAAALEWPVQEFTFLHPSNWIGTTKDERYPKRINYWQLADPFLKDGQESESFADLMVRIKYIYDLIRKQKNAFIVIYTHEEFALAFYWSIYLGKQEFNSENMKRFHSFICAVRFPNCAIIKYRFIDNEIWASNLIMSHLG